jgi:hypothetical protein
MQSRAGVGDRVPDAIHPGVGAKQQNESYYQVTPEMKTVSSPKSTAASPRNAAHQFLAKVQHGKLRG